MCSAIARDDVAAGEGALRTGPHRRGDGPEPLRCVCDASHRVSQPGRSAVRARCPAVSALRAVLPITPAHFTDDGKVGDGSTDTLAEDHSPETTGARCRPT